ncbi:glycosyltransferase family 2 protein [uncultured Anaerococcus sp.]|uniref:TIGR04283 family arsenosugar biosynthesis glycosyltransferase n=1 Tax=uncultured Anaerococcus sp. TaxID=293428 RepID=UPI0026107DD2|nr:glycosyltransferase family 2 protein [uncultured Anaerococcus sp.]
MVTIIIPTYNEENNIKSIENVLSNLKGDFEVIFTDGFSSDHTFDTINYPKIQKARYRSNQMNEACKLARGDYLFFLHCDSIIGSDCINLIEESNTNCGCFKIEFFPNNWKLKLIADFSNRRVKKNNIAFGDQGIFIKKELFFKLGGYKPIALMEDYQLSMDLNENGIKIKQLDYIIYSSSRRFTDKEFLTGIRMKKLQKLYRKGYDIDEIASMYKKI